MVLVAIALVEVGLDVYALVDLYRRPADQVVLGNKWIWVAIILLVNLLGAILYLAIGHKPAPAPEVPSEAVPAPRIDSIVDSLYGPPDDAART